MKTVQIRNPAQETPIYKNILIEILKSSHHDSRCKPLILNVHLHVLNLGNLSMSAWSYNIILKFAPWTCLRFTFEGFATFIKVCMCVSLSQWWSINHFMWCRCKPVLSLGEREFVHTSVPLMHPTFKTLDPPMCLWMFILK